MGKITWTPEQEKYLRENWPDTDKYTIAKALGKTPESVKNRASKMKLLKAVQRKKWTGDDDAEIRKHYPLGDLDALCGVLNVTKQVLWNRAREIGVKRDADLAREQARALCKKLADSDKGRRFKKGNVSHNKGKKITEFLSADTIVKFKSNQFKKGQRPHNTKPVGYERINTEGYVEVKVRDVGRYENFEFKQRLEYEKHFGPVPAGMMVTFADGNKMNFSPDNLLLVSKEENGRRNMENYHALPAEIKENIRLLNTLKKAIS